MFKINNKNTRATSMANIVNFEYISHLFLLLTLNKKMLAGYIYVVLILKAGEFNSLVIYLVILMK